MTVGNEEHLSEKVVEIELLSLSLFHRYSNFGGRLPRNMSSPTSTHANAGIDLVAVTWTFIDVSLYVVSLRFYPDFFIIHLVRIDSYLTFLTFVSRAFSPVQPQAWSPYSCVGLVVGHCVASLYADQRSLRNGDTHRHLESQRRRSGAEVLLDCATLSAPRARIGQDRSGDISCNHTRTSECEYQACVLVDRRCRPAF